MKNSRPRFGAIVLAIGCAAPATMNLLPRRDVAWPVYRGDPKGNQYSALAQIHAANVHLLRPAWEYHTGDAAKRGSSMYSKPKPVGVSIAQDSLKAWKFSGRRARSAHFVERSPINLL